MFLKRNCSLQPCTSWMMKCHWSYWPLVRGPSVLDQPSLCVCHLLWWKAAQLFLEFKACAWVRIFSLFTKMRVSVFCCDVLLWSEVVADIITSAIEGGRRLCFHPCLSVCLFVWADISKSCGWIWTKFDGQVGYVTRTNWFDFGEDPNPDPDSRIFQVILHPWEMGKNYVSHDTVSLKVVDDLWQK